MLWGVSFRNARCWARGLRTQRSEVLQRISATTVYDSNLKDALEPGGENTLLGTACPGFSMPPCRITRARSAVEKARTMDVVWGRTGYNDPEKGQKGARMSAGCGWRRPSQKHNRLGPRSGPSPHGRCTALANSDAALPIQPQSNTVAYQAGGTNTELRLHSRRPALYALN